MPSFANVARRQAIQMSVAKRGLAMNMIEVYLDSSKTPLPMSSDSFLLANSTLWVKGNHSDGPNIVMIDHDMMM